MLLRLYACVALAFVLQRARQSTDDLLSFDLVSCEEAGVWLEGHGCELFASRLSLIAHLFWVG